MRRRLVIGAGSLLVAIAALIGATLDRAGALTLDVDAPDELEPFGDVPYIRGLQERADAVERGLTDIERELTTWPRVRYWR